MALPVIFHDNRYDDNTPVASGTAAGYSVLNLRDWRPFTLWKPDALPATVTADACDASLTWEFTNSADGWALAGGTVTLNPTTITLTSTGADPQFNSPAITGFDGSIYRYVMVRYKRTAGAGWDGSLYYQTQAHAQSGSYVKHFTETAALGTYQVAVLDMWALDAGGTDWQTSLITQLRIDFGATNADVFEVDWIGVAKNPYADYGLLWGHNIASQSSIRVYVQTDDVGDFVAPTWNSTPTYPANNNPVLHTFTARASRFWRWVLDTGTGAPTVAIASIGSRLTFPCAIAQDQGYDPTYRKVYGQNNRSAGGYPLGRVTYFESYEQTLAWSLLSWSWIRGTFLPAWSAHLRDRPFVFAWDTDLYPTDFKLLSVKDELRTPVNTGAYSDLQFDVIGLSTV